MRDLVTTDISILGAPLVVMGLTRLWAGARAANYLWPFFNTVISNVPGPRQTMYCAGAPATHYFPVSIPYHGCALNITVQSYLDQLDFGLIACRETVPDAQRIADYIVEDFAAMREADAPLSAPGAVETIAMAQRAAAPLAAHKPIALGEAKVEPPAPKVEKTSALSGDIDALGEATEALLRRLGKTRAAPAKTPAVKAKAAAPQKRAASTSAAVKRAPPEDAPAPPRRTQSVKVTKPTPPRRRGKPPPRRRSEP